MSEKLTLSDVDKKAEQLYSQYKGAYWEKVHNGQMLETPLTAESLAEQNRKLPFEGKKAYQKRMGEAAATFTVDYTEAAVEAEETMDRNLEEAKAFAHDDAEQLQELARMQAHMDGVDISREDPSKDSAESQ